jgi:hypothetical protein
LLETNSREITENYWGCHPTTAAISKEKPLFFLFVKNIGQSFVIKELWLCSDSSDVTSDVTRRNKSNEASRSRNSFHFVSTNSVQEARGSGNNCYLLYASV